jgi:L-gulono-1,4-lactone dehydrogenase
MWIYSGWILNTAPAPITRVPVSKPFWENYIDQQKCYPQEYRKVSSLEDLVQAVMDARAKKETLRAVGSGHSFSNICPTTGVLVDPHGMNKVLQPDATTLKESSRKSVLVSVQSGITIRDLNTTLLANGKALATMGAYDGQTLAGESQPEPMVVGLVLGQLRF